MGILWCDDLVRPGSNLKQKLFGVDNWGHIESSGIISDNIR